jgi:hypothetical protein
MIHYIQKKNKRNQQTCVRKDANVFVWNQMNQVSQQSTYRKKRNMLKHRRRVIGCFKCKRTGRTIQFNARKNAKEEKDDPNGSISF